MKKRFLFVVVALVPIGVFTLPAGAATATPITACGQLITTDAVLKADLTCSGTALTVAASNVTIRLDGNSISSADGLGVGIAIGVPPTSGSPPSAASPENVVIRDGTVSGFAIGVTVRDSATGRGQTLQNELTHLYLNSNRTGVETYSDGATVVVDHDTIVGTNGIGAQISSFGAAVISKSTITATQTSLGLSGIEGSRVEHSQLDGGWVDLSINAGLNIDRSTLSNVTFDCSESVYKVTNTKLVGGTTHPASACAESFDRDRFVGPGSGTAIGVTGDTESASITNSVFTGWDTAVVLEDADRPMSITGNTFDRNHIGLSSCIESIYCPSGAGTITDNRFVGNTGVGLVLDQGQWSVGKNTMLRNGGLGIDAEFVPLTSPTYAGSLTITDLGSDVARRNHLPQCVGVVCTAH